jgi:hypothetical protein
MDLNMESVRFIWRYGVIGGGQAGTLAYLGLCVRPSVCVGVYVRWGEGGFYLYVLVCQMTCFDIPKY